ncbi:MAG TPA: class I SAM-dependent methyltransferase [Allosphingosinicella sp.]
MLRYLARQFAQPTGLVGRLLIAPWLDWISRRMNALALERLALVGDEDVVEIGFGGGALLRSLRRRSSGTIWGVDVSEAAVARARSRSPGVKIRTGSVEALPLPDGSLDAAVSVNSLYFWPDPDRAFLELARVVKPAGRLVICFEPAEELRKWPGHRYGFRLYEPGEVRALMEDRGFGQIEEAWGTGRKPDRFCCLSGTRLSANG